MLERAQNLINELNPGDVEPTPPPGRWQVFRDVVVFQFKLALDGLRDLLLSPISIGAALIGLITDGRDPGKYFYPLMHLGRQSDRWIDLFNHFRDEERDHATADDVVRRAEEIIRAEYEKGGVMKQMKDHADGVMDQLQQQGKRRPDDKDEPEG